MKPVRGDLEGCLETENSTNFSFKTTQKRKAQMPFSRHEAFFVQFLLEPLTLLLIGEPLTLLLIGGRFCFNDAPFSELTLQTIAVYQVGEIG
jgi:hypothetical protein